MAEQIQAVADDAKADLEEAMPALNAAVDSLKALNKNDITEIKSFPKPPPLVQVSHSYTAFRLNLDSHKLTNFYVLDHHATIVLILVC